MDDRLPTPEAIRLARQQTAEIQRPYRKQRAKRNSGYIVRWETKMRLTDPARLAEYHAEGHRRRYQRKLASRSGVDPAMLAEADRLSREMLTAEFFFCRYCHEQIDQPNRTVDHVIPLSKGGKHESSNLAPSCKSCNSRKNTASEWFG